MEYSAFISSVKRLTDIATIFLAGYLAYILRFRFVEIETVYELLVLLGALLFTLVGTSLGLYGSWRGRNIWQLYRRMAWVGLLSFALLFVLLVFSKTSSTFSRHWLALWMLISLVGLMTVRFVVYSTLGWFRDHGVNQKQILILGITPTAFNILDRLQRNEWLGFKVAGVVPLLEKCKVAVQGANLYSVPCLDIKEEIPQYIKDHNITEVWLCLPLKKGELIQDLLHQLRHCTVNIRYAPDMSDFQLLNHKVTELAGFYTLDLSCSSIQGVNSVVKQFEDSIFALLIFIVISPLLVLIALGVKLSSPGPVLFKQKRYGIDGKAFNVYKFRTMCLHHEEGQLTQAKKSDPRVTPLGAFLRRTSLDELPQFFNVLQGKMSIVGPRPHAVVHNEHYKDKVQSYMKRHKVKPGITGWAQINGYRGETDTVAKMKKRVEHDLYYIENWSLWLDLKIIFMTLIKGFVNKNAY